MAKVTTKSNHGGTIRGLSASVLRNGCLKVTARVAGKTTNVQMCAVGWNGDEAQISVQRQVGKRHAGMTACLDEGEARANYKRVCVRGTSFTIRPGGGATPRSQGRKVYGGH